MSANERLCHLPPLKDAEPEFFSDKASCQKKGSIEFPGFSLERRYYGPISWYFHMLFEYFQLFLEG